ncbi:Qat anti-phage system TatD family nuclease QatD [Acetobacter senegalensis]|uniref:Qat anti-phage system TatD family nuclease QatD n=1 Tax=Acetobacter senegalensis TaxID=446692 RepID=UPI001EE132C9|nr:Qat anti-phage system TatD family nuclease QatD [Acetobacter senegalensis]MCG4274510.1 TatD family hydrolase [Acetobacter senegalensis]
MIDFHAHLDLYSDPHTVVRECVARHIYVLSVTTTPSAWSGTMALAKNAPRIRTALGLHPQLAHERKGELPLFEGLLPQVRYIGEIGLDGGPEYRQYWLDQQQVFFRILKLCASVGGRIMSIHSRRASTEVLDALTAEPDAGIAILHWFSGTQKELARAVDLGCWFSVGPAMLAGAKGQALAKKIPRDRILTETDGPFIQINGQAAWPWDADRAAESLSKIWSQPIEATQNQLLSNLRRLTSYAIGTNAI